MPKYSVALNNWASGAVADTFATAIGLKAADTTGHRGRLRSLFVGPADDAPVDLNVCVKINRADNSIDGTSTAETPAKRDSLSIASVMTGGVNYTVEPTVYETNELWAADFNRRGGILKEWSPEDAPSWGPDQTLGILAAPRTASAATLTITIEWEEY